MSLPRLLRQRQAQADGVHVLLTLFVIVLFIGLAFAAYFLYKGKTTNVSNYQADSKPIVQEPSYTSHFGCNNVKIDEYYERKNNDTNINKAGH